MVCASVPQSSYPSAQLSDQLTHFWKKVNELHAWGRGAGGYKRFSSIGSGLDLHFSSTFQTWSAEGLVSRMTP